ncbi:hypothetical protein Aph01nite_53790 [Acrocarpospora phusangensis]|uniref:Uncharacterized protein n=1 Tax=Acrocarpospora phusangensis TaxID=1070424 RepID=A0A919QFV1_9ACTN|nr:hypothetical protein [Acrocarpospora phusangensis]GIH27069.1 hypothetical protein Aph01nite_53790 [Acrocarpospora phusangensis]
MTEPANYGVTISGGNISGPVAAGDHARAVQNISQTPAADDLIARIETLLTRHGRQLDDPAGAHADLRRIGSELALPNPDHTVIGSRLERLAQRVASIAVLAEAVATLATLLLPGS